MIGGHLHGLSKNDSQLLHTVSIRCVHSRLHVQKYLRHEGRDRRANREGKAATWLSSSPHGGVNAT